MDRVEMIREWVKKNNEPEREFCPEINQYFKTSKGYEIWNSKTLLRERIPYDPTSWQATRDYHIVNKTSVRSSYEGFYVRNIKELKCLEISYVVMDGGRGQNSVPKSWDYYGYRSRYFIFKDGNVYDAMGDEHLVNVGGRYNKGVYKDIHSWHSLFTSMVNYKELKKFDKTANFNDPWRDYDNDSLYAPLPYQYAEWYKRNLVPRKPSKLVDKLKAYELKEIDYPEGVENKIMVYQQLDEEYAVLRYFGDRYYKGERARLFISSKGKPTLMVKEGENWEIKGSTTWALRGKPIIINRKEMETWKPLRYILPCLGDEITIENICDYLRHPIIEQLYKSGYEIITKSILSDRNIVHNLKTYFLIEKETKQPLYKMLGVNKYVLNAAEKRKSNNLRIIRELKYFFGQFDISNCPEDVAEKIANYITDKDKGYSSNSITELVYHNDGRYAWWTTYAKYETLLTEKERKWILKLIRMEDKEEGCLRTYKDIIRTYRAIDIKPEIDLYDVHSLGDITRLHDALVQLKIQQDQERQARYNEHQKKMREAAQKQFEKLQDARIEKFEYENETYCIRVPKELDEITKEGVMLSHCVGGYLNRHANGETNIMFLRKKEDEKTPWFTIEIDNGNHVVQIHGSHNRWLGNEPEVISFVYEWLTKIGADFDKKLLLNKGVGYSPSSETLDESYLQAA